MKPISKLISLDKAMEICFGEIKEIEDTEIIHLGEACGRVIAEDIKSSVNVPPFARSAMDGYAVISENTFGAGQNRPKKFKFLEKIHAGEVPSLEVTEGLCSQIATGAMLPPGADAVVKVEDTELEGEEILVYRPVHPGSHVSPEGEDVAVGNKVLEKGNYLTPAKTGVLAALGIEEVKVYRRPEAVIIPTGKEVRPLGAELSPGQIYDVNSHTLKAILSANGVKTLIHPEILEDRRETVEEAIKHYKDTADLIIFSGGSSVGERDVIVEAIKKEGLVLFHGIAVKPGKPTLFGKAGRTLIFGMPGNPASCLSNSYIMLLPLIRRMARLPEDRKRKVMLPMAKRITSELGRHQFLTIKIEEGKVFPVFKTSSAITSMSEADGYIEIPLMVDLLEKDAEVEVILF